jgi:hypothetical protein
MLLPFHRHGKRAAIAQMGSVRGDALLLNIVDLRLLLS